MRRPLRDDTARFPGRGRHSGDPSGGPQEDDVVAAIGQRLKTSDRAEIQCSHDGLRSDVKSRDSHQEGRRRELSLPEFKTGPYDLPAQDGWGCGGP